jgi:uncharacterized protein involved in tolerance to divalent cations
LKYHGKATTVGAPQYQVASLTLEEVLSSSVSKHLEVIADSIYEWEGAVAKNLELTPADIADIKTQYSKKMNLQA